MEAAPITKRTAFQGPCYYKMLVNNIAAGAIIGKNGSVIASIEQQTACALKLSPANMYYPGTQERVLVMSGEQENLNNALLLILGKIYDSQLQYGEGGSKEPYEPLTNANGSSASQGGKMSYKVVVPKSSVSSIIGKGGQQIRDLQESTNARVQVSSREEGLVERIVSVSGALEQVRAASLTLALCIQGDVNLKEHMYVVYKQNPLGVVGPVVGAYGGVGGQGMNNFGQNFSTNHYGLGGGVNISNAHNQQQPGQEVLVQHCEIQIQVSEQSVGAVIGRSGKVVSEVMKQTGARVQISQKGDFVTGTTDRKILISGSVAAVHSAHIVLLQRIQAVQEQLNAGNQGNGAHQQVDIQQQQHTGGMLMQGNMQYVHPGGFSY